MNELTIASQNELLAGVDQNFSTMNEQYSEMSSDQKTVKSLNELEKLSSIGNTYIDKLSSLTLTSVHNAQTANDFSLPVDQKIIDNMLIKNDKILRIKLSPKKPIDIISIINHNLSDVKPLTNNSLSSDTNQVEQHDVISTRITQSMTETNLLPNFRNKFVKLQLTTNFECHDYDEQILCKKIELKKYVEFDISSFWNKK